LTKDIAKKKIQKKRKKIKALFMRDPKKIKKNKKLKKIKKKKLFLIIFFIIIQLKIGVYQIMGRDLSYNLSDNPDNDE